MDDNLNDLEVGISSNIPRNLNKRMRKRKHLDSLLKFRSKKTNSNDILRSSEDELFLPHQKSSITKLRSSSYRRCWNYSKHILSFSLICIFMIVCISLTYANIELKNEVQNLSSRINEIEKKFSNMELKNISSTIEQIKTHLNFSLQNDSVQLQKIKQKSTQFSEITNELDVINQKAEIRLENIVNESIIGLDKQFNSFRNEIQSFNHKTKIQELKISLKQLTNLVHNSSNKVSIILTEFQSDLDKLRNQIDECKCSKESTHSKPLVVDNDQLQQNIADVEQIVNEPSVTG